MNDPFKNLDDDQKKILIKDYEGQTLSFEKNQSLKSYFNMSNTIGIVLSGAVLITRNDYNGSKYLISIVEINQAFGPKFFPINKNEYEIVADEDCSILILDYNNITRFENNNADIHHQFLVNLLETTMDIIKDNNKRLSIISQRSTRDKLLQYFELEYQRTLSKNIYLPFTFKDLADYLTVDRSAMTREIKHLKDEKIIEIHGHKIVLLYK